ncbi:hypothetical protein Tco_0564469 [Tanacetum coccineum]
MDIRKQESGLKRGKSTPVSSKQEFHNGGLFGWRFDELLDFTILKCTTPRDQYAQDSVMSDSDESGVTHTEISSPYEDLSRLLDHLEPMNHDRYQSQHYKARVDPSFAGLGHPPYVRRLTYGTTHLMIWVPESDPEADPELLPPSGRKNEHLRPRCVCGPHKPPHPEPHDARIYIPEPLPVYLSLDCPSHSGPGYEVGESSAAVLLDQLEMEEITELQSADRRRQRVMSDLLETDRRRREEMRELRSCGIDRNSTSSRLLDLDCGVRLLPYRDSRVPLKVPASPGAARGG